MAIRIGINGFGRIGRMFLRAALTRKDLEVVAVNDITDAATLAHLLQYDSVHGALKSQVKLEGNTIMVDGHGFEVLAERDPSKLPWKRNRRTPKSASNISRTSRRPLRTLPTS